MEILKFLRQNLYLVELLAGLIGLYFWNTKISKWRAFAIYLFFIAFIEAFARFGISKEYRPIFYSYTAPFQLLFPFWLFGITLNKQKWVLCGTIIYIIAFVFDVFLSFQIIENQHFRSFSYLVGNIALLIFILRYFYEMVQSDKLLLFYQEQMFWVVMGFLLFYLGTFPYFGLYNYLKINHIALLSAYGWVVTGLNYVMYILFALSFIWDKKS